MRINPVRRLLSLLFSSLLVVGQTGAPIVAPIVAIAVLSADSIAAISRIGADTAQSNGSSGITISPAAGDLILVFAHRDGSATPPTLASGYLFFASAGANTNSAIVGYKIADGTETTAGTWTNATSIAVLVYRGHDPNCPLGSFAIAGSSSTTLSFTGVTLQVTDSSSWVAGFAGHRTATDVGTNAPAGMASRSSATDVAAFDTNGGVSSWSTGTASVNANSGWRTAIVEIRAAPTTSAPSPDPLVWHSHYADSLEDGNAFTFYFPHTSLANNCLQIFFVHTTGISVSSVVDSNSTSWTAITSETAVNGNRDARLYQLVNAPATSWVKVTFSGNSSNMIAMISQFYGVATSSAVDGTSTHAATTTLPIKSGAITTTQTGDLLVQYTADCQQVYGNLSSECYGISGENGYTLLSANLRNASAAVYGIVGGAGSYNPGIAYLQPSNPDTFASLTVALKMNGSGTAPSGMRVVREYTHSPFLAAVEQVQFPTSGNLVWVATTVPDNQNVMSAATDAQGNTYTRKNLDTSAGQLLYAANATASIFNRIETTFADAGYYAKFYDVAGANTSPYDQEAFTTQSTGAGADLNLPSFITPSTSSGMTLIIIPTGTGPFLDADAPTGAITDVAPYTGETDAGNMNFGDFLGHFFYSSTAAQSWNMNTAFPGTSDSAPSAFTFKAASAPASTSRGFFQLFQ